MLKNVIIILNWNGFDDTDECLTSLFGIENKNFDIILVDNASEQEDFRKLSAKYGDLCTIIRNESNLGFAGGNNVGIKYALKKKYEYITLLNNDTVVEKDFLNFLTGSIKNNSKVGICAPIINYFSEPLIVWSNGGYINKFRGTGVTYNEGKPNELFAEPQYRTFVSGCCFTARSEVFLNVGFFDENYFLYLEDADFCKRVSDYGYYILVEPKSKIYHKVNSSLKKTDFYLPVYYMTRNRLYFAKKFYKKIFWLVYIYIMGVSYLKMLFNNNGKKTEYFRKALRDYKANKFGHYKDN